MATTIVGNINTFDVDEPVNAIVRFTLSNTIVQEDSGTLVTSGFIDVTPDINGEFSIELEPNNTSPYERGLYSFEIYVGSTLAYRKRNLVVPTSNTDVDITTVISNTQNRVPPVNFTFTQDYKLITGNETDGQEVGTFFADGSPYVAYALLEGTKNFRIEGDKLLLKDTVPSGSYTVKAKATNLEGSNTNVFYFSFGLASSVVTPGAPGSFDQDPPEDLTGLRALGSLGQTAHWVAGDYVVLGDLSEAYWDGDSWEAGRSVTAPGQMDAPTLVDTGQSATLQFAAEPSNGGTAITSYEYEVTTEDDTSFISVIAQGNQNNRDDVSITPLTPGNYIARTRAVNPNGNGGWSVASASTEVTGVLTINSRSRDSILYDSGAARGENSADIPMSGTTTNSDGLNIELSILTKDEIYQKGLLKGAVSLSSADVKAVMPSNAATMIANFRSSDNRDLATLAAAKGWTLAGDDYAGTITITGVNNDYGAYYDFEDRRVIFANNAVLRCSGIRCRNMQVQSLSEGLWVNDVLILQGSGDGIEPETSLVVQVPSEKFFAGQIISTGYSSDAIACGDRLRFGIAYADCPIQHPEGQTVPVAYNNGASYSVNDTVVAAGQSLTGPYHRALNSGVLSAPVVGSSSSDWAYIDYHSDGIQGSPNYNLVEGGIFYFNIDPNKRIVDRQDPNEVIRVNAPLSLSGSGHVDLDMIIFEQNLSRPSGPRWTVNAGDDATASIQTGTVTGPNSGGNFVGATTLSNISIGSVINEQTGSTLIQSGITVIDTPVAPTYESLYADDVSWAGQRIHTDWQLVGTTTSGSWSGTILGVKKSPFILELQSRVQGGVSAPVKAPQGIKVGHKMVKMGASNSARLLKNQFDEGTAPDISDNTRINVVVSESPVLPNTIADNTYTSVGGYCTSHMAKWIKTAMDKAPNDFFEIAFDAHSGENWVGAFRNNDLGRDFGATQLLFDYLQEEGSSIGAIYLEFSNAFDTGPLSHEEALARFCFAKDLAGNPVAEVQGSNFADFDCNVVINYTVQSLITNKPPVFYNTKVAPPSQTSTADISGSDALNKQALDALTAAYPNDVITGLVDFIARRNNSPDSHIDETNEGFGRNAAAYGYSMLHCFGFVELPTLTVEEFTQNVIRLSSSMGPITTLERIQNGGGATNFDGGTAEIMGIYGSNIPNEWPVSEIRTAAGDPATEGEIHILPNGGVFDGDMSFWLFPDMSVTFSGSSGDWDAGRWKHFGAVAVSGFTSLDCIMIQPPELDLINDANQLSATDTFTVTNGVPSVVSSGNVTSLVGPGAEPGLTVEASVIYDGANTINILTDEGSNNFTRIAVGGPGNIIVRLRDSGLNSIVDYSTADEIIPVGVLTLIRVSVDNSSNTSRIFVDDVEVGSATPFVNNTLSHKGSQKSELLRSPTTAEIERVSVWREVAAGGAAPVTDPWFEVISSGSSPSTTRQGL